jgi:hypothetical protein
VLNGAKESLGTAGLTVSELKRLRTLEDEGQTNFIEPFYLIIVKEVLKVLDIVY